jgi:hypothetical protein
VVVCGGHREVFHRTQSTTRSQGLRQDLSQQDFWDFSSDKKSNQMDLRYGLYDLLRNELANVTLTEAWECYHGFVIDLRTAGMEDWEFNQGFYCALSQEAKEHIDALAGGTIFMLNAEKARALLEKLSTSKRESEEYGLKENSRATKIDPITRKF